MKIQGTLFRALLIIGAFSSQFGLVAAESNDSPELTIRKFLAAIYSNDKKTFEETIVPNKDSGKMLSKPFVGDEKAKQINELAQNVRLLLTEPYTFQGKPIKPSGTNGYPSGTRVIYQTQFQGTLLGIVCVKQTNEWRIDLRWWLAGMKELQTNSPENSVKWFLYSQLTQQKEGIEKYSVPGMSLKGIEDLKPPAQGDWDVIEGLVEVMGLVKPEPDEIFLLPNGNEKKIDKSKTDELFLVGILGAEEVTFELKRIGEEWKVVPYDYLTPLHKKNAL